VNGLRLLTDENIDPQVITHLRDAGFDVIDIFEADLRGRSDQQILDLAYQQQRVVLTHDSDFGTLAIHQHRPMIGIIYLRPGHIDPAFTTATLDAIRHADPDLQPPFILVAKRSGTRVTIRLRRPFTDSRE